MNQKPQIFLQYPSLENNIPWIPLINAPTPVEQLELPQNSEYGAIDNLWIKRDDLTHSLYGGNKVRKLEFILADVIRKKKRNIVTLGAIGTNHGIATSLFGHLKGIGCTIYTFDQPVTSTVKENQKLLEHLGTTLKHKGTILRAALSFYCSQVFSRAGAYYLPAGGSSLLGCLGFVNAAFELKTQIDSGLLIEPDYIYCPVGSSGTLAGLTLGCKLAGLNASVIGVRVAPSHLGVIPICTTKTISTLMEKTYKYLRKLAIEVPEISMPTIDLKESFYGDGYGCPTESGTKAINLFSKADIKLESTYTAKSVAAALQHCKESPDKKTLYWHTFNSVDTLSQLSN
ncbi:1-aminocyclopropane-1-carboxylate deaminase/D-cysteine desulfhydrase [Pleionea sp. CnH1-48]|uniref:1-aminocyclopropane-1-carboxylate deaminase/D-cysteine desulfhydrase n=1 Tax=Pleionea sp. CnH1-48 TaxID=2954494 RepID=UPI0020973305|nr:pyridoxal-phosphate dependent enzyme [Pleionea sp. CnH1-48]MCO7225262.1 pyridoxal-phosphate dependent enzyme [Pleionea sp. CnH1-48]